MSGLSRRQLARYAADQLLDKVPAKIVMSEMAAILIQTRRSGQAELLASDIAWELEGRGKVATAQVISAHQLSDTLRSQITSFVKKQAKVDEVIIDSTIDSSVIGGVRIETAAHGWDQTIKRQLNDIQEAF